jgi:hypothetical protein
MRVLFDSAEGLAAKVIDRTKAAYQAGPKQLTAEQKSVKLMTLERLLARIEGTLSRPEVCFYHLGYFYELAIRYWFEFQGEWSLPISEAMQAIKASDLRYHSLLSKIVLLDAPGRALAASQILTCLRS